MAKKPTKKQLEIVAKQAEDVECKYSQEYVEWLTGGPEHVREKCIEMGGTCQRPDIITKQNSCDGCEFFKYCLVSSKRLKIK